MPSNTSPATAIAITMPFSVSVGATSPGDELWYKFTTAPTLPMDYFISTGAGTTSSNFQVQSTIYASDGTTILYGPITQAANYYNVTPNTTYYFKINLTNVTVIDAGQFFVGEGQPDSSYVAGDLFIPFDDTSQFTSAIPGTIIDRDTGEVRQLVAFPYTESAAITPEGVLAAHDEGIFTDFVVFDEFLNETHRTQVFTGNSITEIPRITSDRVGFWTMQFDPGVSTTLGTIHHVDDTGVILGTWHPPITHQLGSFGVTVDGAIAYYSELSGAGFNDGAVKRYDLVNDIALTNFVAAQAGYVLVPDIIPLADNTLLIAWTKSNSAVADSFVRHYNAGGTLLNTYTFTEGFMDHMAVAEDDPVSFWCWFQPRHGILTFTFQQVIVATGVILRDITSPEISETIGPTLGADTDPLFGVTFSCPLVVLRAGGGGGAGGGGVGDSACYPYFPTASAECDN